MISPEQLKRWRSEAKGAMHSAVDEYCPKDEFFALIDEVERLQAQVALAIACNESRGGA